MENSYIYTGNPITPRFTLNIGNKTLKDETDFDVEITDNINVGTAHVTIRGKGKYTGVINRTFEILPVPARSLSFFADNTEFDYTGEPCIMQVAVKFGDITLEEGRDYSVEYIDNIGPGKANARISFFGNYQGVMTIPFNIYGDTAAEDTKKKDDPSKVKNTSELSSCEITLGEEITVNASAQGGAGGYTYAVCMRASDSQKWHVPQYYTSKTVFSFKPTSADDYVVCVKAKDSAGEVGKVYFDIRVNEPEGADE